jgi:restriction endonuclease S subunit
VKLEMRTLTRGFDRYLYRLLLTSQYRLYCAGRITGSAQVGLSREDFLSYPVLLPPNEVLARFGDVDAMLCARQDSASAESKLLAELRDLLLPKLISGELRARAAEKLVEAVL